jgi:hypothetical protein
VDVEVEVLVEDAVAVYTVNVEVLVLVEDTVLVNGNDCVVETVVLVNDVERDVKEDVVVLVVDVTLVTVGLKVVVVVSGGVVTEATPTIPLTEEFGATSASVERDRSIITKVRRKFK